MDRRHMRDALAYGEKDKRKYFPAAFDERIISEIKSSTYHKCILDEIKQAGEELLRQPLIALPYSQYKLFYENGSRKEYETSYFSRRKRLNVFAALVLLEKNSIYLEALEDTMWAMCDEFSWAVPAHMSWGDKPVSIHSEKTLVANRDQGKHIDLFAAEAGYALSEICVLLEDRLSPLVINRVRQEVYERIIQSYCEADGAFWWEYSTNNWSAVCAGSVGVAAIYMIEEEALLEVVLSRVLGTLECFLDGYGEDGVCLEGLNYWAYGFGYYVYFADILKKRTNGRIDLFKNPKVKKIAMFQQNCFLSENKTISFSDSVREFVYKEGLTSYLKSVYEEFEVPDRAYRCGYFHDNCYRWAHASRNLFWDVPMIQEDKNNHQGTCYLEDAEWFISKTSVSGEAVCFVAKAGTNDEPHNHNDAGTFIYHLAGDTLFTDIGAGEYTKQYFGEERYDLLCNSSRGHSLPIVEGNYQQAGCPFVTEVLEVQTSSNSKVFAIEIGKSYGNDNLQSLVRRYHFNEQTGHLEIQDKGKFKNIPTAFVERFVTVVLPIVCKDGEVCINGQKGEALLKFDEGIFDCVISREKFVNIVHVEETVYLIDLVVKTDKLSADFEANITIYPALVG